MEKIQKSKFLIFLTLAITYFIALPATATAADLYFSPSSGSYTVGSSISVGVFVSSANQAMNAASGVISFPQDKLEVVSLSKTGSIFTLWVQEPSSSNSTGMINLEGIVLNPGFTGVNGKIVTINFKVKAAGVAPLEFSSASVLANDGQGTNILTNLKSASFSLGIKQNKPKAETPAAIIGTPSAPQISSLTHPDTTEWYANSNPEFTWTLSSDITATRLLVERTPQSIPTVQYRPAISSKDVADLADGVWYFHVRLQNDAGWGGISHFSFQIDTKKPSSFDIKEIERKDLTDPKVKFVFDAKDETSGIAHYEVRIDSGNTEIWKDDGTHTFVTSLLGSGKHTLLAKAIDKAGNSLASSADFTIEEIEKPTIVEYPKELTSGEVFIAKGITYPNAQVVVWLQRNKEDTESNIIESDRSGNFTFIADEKLKDGIYKLWAEVVDERGARSKSTEKVTIVVKQPTILKIGAQAVTILTVIVTLIALIVLLLALVWYSWYKFSSSKKRIRKETKETEQALHKTIELLKENIEGQIKLLEKTKTKRQFTKEEDRIIKQLKKDLDDAERFVKKEIKDIEKEVE